MKAFSGLKFYKKYLDLGNFISTGEALRIGLVNRVVSQEEVMESTKALGREIAGSPV